MTVFDDLFQFRITFGETSNFQEKGRKFPFRFPGCIFLLPKSKQHFCLHYFIISWWLDRVTSNSVNLFCTDCQARQTDISQQWDGEWTCKQGWWSYHTEQSTWGENRGQERTITYLVSKEKLPKQPPAKLSQEVCVRISRKITTKEVSRKLSILSQKK